MRGLIQVLQPLCRLMSIVSIILLGLLAFPIAYDATMRAFGKPTIWVFETTLYLFIAGGFLANTLAMSSGAHFRVMILAQAFPSLKPALDWLALILTLLFSILLIGTGSYFVWYSWSNDILSASLLEVPLWIPQLAIPIGGVGLFLQTLIHICEGKMPEGKEAIME